MDIFEKFVEDESNDGEVASIFNSQVQDRLHVVGGSEADLPRVEGKAPRGGYAPGYRVNYFTVQGKHYKKGTYGQFSNGDYIVKCVCGKKMLASYHQIYYGTAFSCGCIARAKHPPIKLEGQRIGRVEVLRWTQEYGGTWEIVCHECGELLYRKTSHQVRAAGQSCASHQTEVG